jgi:hypothetical protein
MRRRSQKTARSGSWDDITIIEGRVATVEEGWRSVRKVRGCGKRDLTKDVVEHEACSRPDLKGWKRLAEKWPLVADRRGWDTDLITPAGQPRTSCCIRAP